MREIFLQNKCFAYNHVCYLILHMTSTPIVPEEDPSEENPTEA